MKIPSIILWLGKQVSYVGDLLTRTYVRTYVGHLVTRQVCIYISSTIRDLHASNKNLHTYVCTMFSSDVQYDMFYTYIAYHDYCTPNLRITL